MYKHWKPWFLLHFHKKFSVPKILLYFKTYLKTAAKPINTGLTAVFYLRNCQRRDHNIPKEI